MPKRHLEYDASVCDFSPSQPPSNKLFFEDSFTEDNEEISIDEEEWEDVPLDGRISITIENKILPNKKLRKERNKKLVQHKYQKIKYGLHIVCIPIYLRVLRQRMAWTNDIRLNRRLKRSIPSIVMKKFRKWMSLGNAEKLDNLRTIILGLVWWFRDHYQINSNGFRQNVHRLQYLISYATKESNSTLYKQVLNEQQLYYGTRPPHIQTIESVRQMARNRKSNRDILTLFFLIILKNMLVGSDISLCFALPLHNYEISCSKVKWQLSHHMGVVPNKYDTDLLQPYFWIELRLPELDETGFYVIDPVVHLKHEEIISRYEIDEPVHAFQLSKDPKLNMNQKFHYVVSINNQTGILRDVSPRYITNTTYRYFDIKPTTTTCKSLNYKSYIYYQSMIKNSCTNNSDIEHQELMKSLAFKNWTLPTTIKETKKSDCFVLKSILRANETLRMSATPIRVTRGSNQLEEPVYWRHDIIMLKCEKHWNQLGRSIIKGVKPLRLKKYTTMKQRREKQLHSYEIRELFSVEQTIQTPKLSSFRIDKYGRSFHITDVDMLKNAHGNIELYSFNSVPDGFKLLPNKPDTKNLIKRQNKRSNKDGNIKFINVVSGFDFKQKPGYAVPQIKHILLNSRDFQIVQDLLFQNKEITDLKGWKELIERLCINARLNSRYGDHKE